MGYKVNTSVEYFYSNYNFYSLVPYLKLPYILHFTKINIKIVDN